MAKLYVAKMLILEPSNYGYNKEISGYKTEEVIVRRVPFGYKEVLTNHFFINGEKISGKTVSDLIVAGNLCSGFTQFILDDNLSFPLREADEKDAKDYVDRFETSTLKAYYDEQARRKEEIQAEKTRQKESKKKAKQIIRTYQKENGK